MDMIPNPLIIPVGIAVGILVSAPVGPVNILCIQRAISRGVVGGMAAGIGAVLGDGVIALFAALGVGAISSAVKAWRIGIQACGGLALLAFAAKLYWTPAPRAAPSPKVGDAMTLREYAWDIPQTFVLTITNPAAVLGLFAIFGAVSTFVEVKNPVDALTMVAAIMAGGLAWWFVLASLTSRLRHKLNPARLQSINRVAAVLLGGFAVILLGEVILLSTGVL